MSVHICQSLFQGNEYYLFRTIGNESYQEIKFHITNGQLLLNQENKLHPYELDFIHKNLF